MSTRPLPDPICHVCEKPIRPGDGVAGFPDKRVHDLCGIAPQKPVVDGAIACRICRRGIGGVNDVVVIGNGVAHKACSEGLEQPDEGVAQR